MSVFVWDRLKCEKRFGRDGSQYSAKPLLLSAFNDDESSIVTSSAFRRLQGKTQVYPFPENDFLRNRLTHTNEVAHIGRTIASLIAKGLHFNHEATSIIVQIVANACFLHDIGNPPFGHSGESSIREFFTDNRQNFSLINFATSDEKYKNDLELFDGNAQGFRVATRLAAWKDNGGLRLTAGTLTAMVKYAFDSTSPAAEKGKFGYMRSEADYATMLFKECGLFSGGVIYRNPLSIIVEAADDIAYLTSDVQDAHRHGDLDFEQASMVLASLCDPSEQTHARTLDNREKQDNEIARLRSGAVTNMTRAASQILLATVFDENQLIRGTDKFDLWATRKDDKDFRRIEKGERQIRTLCNKLVYRGKRKISLQVAGGRIIKFVLEMQLKALEEIYKTLHPIIKDYPEKKAKEVEGLLSVDANIIEYIRFLVENIDRFKSVSRESAQIFWGMPSNAHDTLNRIFKTIYDEKRDLGDAEMAYLIVQISLDFVSGTTDRYLSDYSRQWSGPNIS